MLVAHQQGFIAPLSELLWQPFRSLAEIVGTGWSQVVNLAEAVASVRDMNLRELALGDRGRSGQQWDIWEAVYSPV